MLRPSHCWPRARGPVTRDRVRLHGLPACRHGACRSCYRTSVWLISREIHTSEIWISLAAFSRLPLSSVRHR